MHCKLRLLCSINDLNQSVSQHSLDKLEAIVPAKLDFIPCTLRNYSLASSLSVFIWEINGKSVCLSVSCHRRFNIGDGSSTDFDTTLAHLWSKEAMKCPPEEDSCAASVRIQERSEI